MENYSNKEISGNSQKKVRIINDAVFGFIPIEPYISVIIDTVEFQRLRGIWQLGLAPFVYPTADHCRFEHSIGTYNLASKLVRILKKQLEDEKSEEMSINERDVMCVEIAALCHDIGHGPFSHFWDNNVLPEILGKNSKTKHEDQFREIWNDKLKEKLNLWLTDELNEKLWPNELKQELSQDEENLIIALIEGKEIKGKELLCGIVSNSESGMDVDKWDYLARDASYLGHSSSNFKIDIDRMMHLMRAIKITEGEDEGKWKIAFRKTEGLNMLRAFQLRHYMYKTAYHHRTVMNIERMMLDGFKQYFSSHEGKSLKTKIGTPEWILKNDQSIFWSNVTKIEEFKRILERDLYKAVFEAEINEKQDDPSVDIIQYLHESNKELYNEYLKDLTKPDKNKIEIIKYFIEKTTDEFKSYYFSTENHELRDKILNDYMQTDEILIKLINDYIVPTTDESVEKIINDNFETTIDEFNNKILKDCIANTIDQLKNKIINDYNATTVDENSKRIIMDYVEITIEEFKKEKYNDYIVTTIDEFNNEIFDSDIEKKDYIAITIDKFQNKIIKDYRIGFCKFKLSSTDNPMLNIPFYRKSNLYEIFKYEEDSLPSHLQYEVDESRIIIFSIQSKLKGTNDHKKIQELLVNYFAKENEKLKKKEGSKNKLWKRNEL